jgi:hypothetical protein
MIVNVRMLAFQPEEKVRSVVVPDENVGSSKVVDLMNAAWYWGQNVHCRDRDITSTTCDVSVGDVAEFPDQGNFMFLPSGPYKLTEYEYHVYKALPRRDRDLFREMIREKLEGE